MVVAAGAVVGSGFRPNVVAGTCACTFKGWLAVSFGGCTPVSGKIQNDTLNIAVYLFLYAEMDSLGGLFGELFLVNAEGVPEECFCTVLYGIGLLVNAVCASAQFKMHERGAYRELGR